MLVNDLKLQAEVNAKEKLKKCADNVIEAFSIMDEAIEEMSGCMLELKASEKSYFKQDCEGINLENNDASIEVKGTLNAEVIIEDMILKLKDGFDEILNVKKTFCKFNETITISREIRKLTECLMMIKNTPKTGVCDVSECFSQIGEKPMKNLQLEELYQLSIDSLSDNIKSLIISLKEQYMTYGLVLEKLDRFKVECLWSHDDAKILKVAIIDYAIKLVKKEMNDLHHTNRS